MTKYSTEAEPQIIPRSEHTLSRSNVSTNALKVLKRLKNAGYSAYLVGGCVRDLLIGRQPKDFDVATDAHPEEVNELFRNSRLIGRRFKIVHVGYGRHTIEVATFRGDGNEVHHDREVRDGGMLIRDNVYGTLEEDVWRRDFTVNSLYYNIADLSIVDYTGGLGDLKSTTLQLIGPPEMRYREDPVRLLRAIRFAAKLGFNIHPDTAEPIMRLGGLLRDVAPARLFDEILKLLMSGFAEQSFYQLEKYGLFKHLFPYTRLDNNEGARQFFIQALKNTDTRIASGKPVTPAFLVATSLWEPVKRGMKDAISRGEKEMIACRESADEVLGMQAELIRQPRRFSTVAREIWMLQPRFLKRKGKRALGFLDHPRFRAAYDFMLLRYQGGEQSLKEVSDWWTKIQQIPFEERGSMVGLSEGEKASRATHKKRRRKKPKQVSKGDSSQ